MTEIKIIFFIVIAGFYSNGFSQSSRQSGSSNCLQLLDSAKFYQNSKPEKAFSFALKALESSITYKNEDCEAQSYYYIGAINNQLNQWDLAQSNLIKAENRAKNLKNSELLTLVYLELLKTREALNNIPDAKKAIENALVQAKKSGDEDLLLKVKREEAAFTYRQGLYEKAILQYDKVLNDLPAQENSDEEYEITQELGDAYMANAAPSQAAVAYKKSVDIAERKKDYGKLSKSYSKLGSAKSEEKKYDEEIQYRTAAINSARKEEKSDPNLILDNQISIGDALAKKGEPDQAISYFEEGISMAESNKNLESKGRALKSLSEVYASQSSYDQALLTYKKYVESVDELLLQKENEVNQRIRLASNLAGEVTRLTQLEKELSLNQMQLDLLEQQQQVQKKALNSQKAIIYSLFSILLMISITSILLVRNINQKKKANMMLALKSLRSQMNPHFIFNALNSVNHYISSNNEREANRFLTKFSKLMRSVLENSKSELIPISEELETIKLYIELEHERFTDQFDFEWNIDSSIDLTDIQIPPMVIQPFVENAIWHGLRYKKEKGVLIFDLNKENEQIKITITDNGIGRKQSQLVKTPHQKNTSSTGISNTSARMQILNTLQKKQMQIAIEDLNTTDQTGTRVTILI